MSLIKKAHELDVQTKIKALIYGQAGTGKSTRVDFHTHTRKYAVGISLKGGIILHATAPSIREVAIALIGQHDDITTSENSEKVYLKKAAL
jgi:hypothetical protein